MQEAAQSAHSPSRSEIASSGSFSTPQGTPIKMSPTKGDAKLSSEENQARCSPSATVGVEGRSDETLEQSTYRNAPVKSTVDSPAGFSTPQGTRRSMDTSTETKLSPNAQEQPVLAVKRSPGPARGSAETKHPESLMEEEQSASTKDILSSPGGTSPGRTSPKLTLSPKVKQALLAVQNSAPRKAHVESTAETVQVASQNSPLNDSMDASVKSPSSKGSPGRMAPRLKISQRVKEAQLAVLSAGASTVKLKKAEDVVGTRKTAVQPILDESSSTVPLDSLARATSPKRSSGRMSPRQTLSPKMKQPQLLAVQASPFKETIESSAETLTPMKPSSKEDDGVRAQTSPEILSIDMSRIPGLESISSDSSHHSNEGERQRDQSFEESISSPNLSRIVDQSLEGSFSSATASRIIDRSTESSPGNVGRIVAALQKVFPEKEMAQEQQGPVQQKQDILEGCNEDSRDSCPLNERYDENGDDGFSDIFSGLGSNACEEFETTPQARGNAKAESGSRGISMHSTFSDPSTATDVVSNLSTLKKKKKKQTQNHSSRRNGSKKKESKSRPSRRHQREENSKASSRDKPAVRSSSSSQATFDSFSSDDTSFASFYSSDYESFDSRQDEVDQSLVRAFFDFLDPEGGDDGSIAIIDDDYSFMTGESGSLATDNHRGSQNSKAKKEKVKKENNFDFATMKNILNDFLLTDSNKSQKKDPAKKRKVLKHAKKKENGEAKDPNSAFFDATFFHEIWKEVAARKPSTNIAFGEWKGEWNLFEKIGFCGSVEAVDELPVVDDLTLTPSAKEEEDEVSDVLGSLYPAGGTAVASKTKAALVLARCREKFPSLYKRLIRRLDQEGWGKYGSTIRRTASKQPSLPSVMESTDEGSEFAESCNSGTAGGKLSSCPSDVDIFPTKSASDSISSASAPDVVPVGPAWDSQKGNVQLLDAREPFTNETSFNAESESDDKPQQAAFTTESVNNSRSAVDHSQTSDWEAFCESPFGTPKRQNTRKQTAGLIPAPPNDSPKIFSNTSNDPMSGLSNFLPPKPDHDTSTAFHFPLKSSSPETGILVRSPPSPMLMESSFDSQKATILHAEHAEESTRITDGQDLPGPMDPSLLDNHIESQESSCPVNHHDPRFIVPVEDAIEVIKSPEVSFSDYSLSPTDTGDGLQWRGLQWEQSRSPSKESFPSPERTKQASLLSTSQGSTDVDGSISVTERPADTNDGFISEQSLPSSTAFVRSPEGIEAASALSSSYSSTSENFYASFTGPLANAKDSFLLERTLSLSKVIPIPGENKTASILSTDHSSNGMAGDFSSKDLSLKVSRAEQHDSFEAEQSLSPKESLPSPEGNEQEPILSTSHSSTGSKSEFRCVVHVETAMDETEAPKVPIGPSVVSGSPSNANDGLLWVRSFSPSKESLPRPEGIKNGSLLSDSSSSVDQSSNLSLTGPPADANSKSEWASSPSPQLRDTISMKRASSEPRSSYGLSSHISSSTTGPVDLDELYDEMHGVHGSKLEQFPTPPRSVKRSTSEPKRRDQKNSPPMTHRGPQWESFSPISFKESDWNDKSASAAPKKAARPVLKPPRKSRISRVRALQGTSQRRKPRTSPTSVTSSESSKDTTLYPPSALDFEQFDG